MSSSRPSPGVRLLTRLADVVFTHRRWFLWTQLLLAVAAAVYAVLNLEFIMDRNALVGGDKESHRHYLEFLKEFPSEPDLVVVVESENIERNRQFVERLGARLEAARIRVPSAPGSAKLVETNLYTGVFYKGDLKLMGSKALLFLPEEALKDLLTMFRNYQPVLRQFTQSTNLVSLVNLVNTQFRTAKREANEANEALVKALPALVRVISLASDAVQRPGSPPSPGVSTLFEGGQEAEQQMYVTYGQGRIFLVTAQARSADLSGDAVERLRSLIAETQIEVPGLNVGLTGEPVLEVDEMLQSQKDTTVASIVALVLCTLMFIYGYNETGRPLKAIFCLLVGVSYTLAYTTLVVGHLNILTITFVPILIGLAIDFGVHLITRYEEELRHGRTEREALEKAMVYTGMGIFTGCFTTAGAFFAMGFTGFKGIQEMGIICGGGLLVCLVPMMTLLPVLLLTGRQNVLDHELGPVLERKATAEDVRRERIEALWLNRPVMTLAAVAGVSVLCVGPALRVPFDYNLLHMQSAGLPAVIYQDKLIHSAQRPLLYAAVVATNLDHALQLTAQLTNLPTVGTIESMVPYLTENQSTKLALLKEVKRVAASIEFQPVDTQPADLTALQQALYSLHGYANLAADETEKDEPELHRQLLALREAVSHLSATLLVSKPAESAAKVALFQTALFNDVRATFQAIQNQDDRDRMKVEDLPAALRHRFVGVTGKHLLQVYPKNDVWERAPQEAFVGELRTVDERATGTPVQLLEYETLLKVSFEEAALYALIAISLLVLVHFRRISCLVLALIPVAVGTLWMMGFMSLKDIAFNPANVMTLPLVIGVGVTNGIHILNRFAEEQHPSILARSTGKAVLVSGLTTIAGFGSLIIAQHRGIESLGYIMAVGTATCMLIGLTFLPAILNLLHRAGWRIKKPSAACTAATGSGGTEDKASIT